MQTIFPSLLQDSPVCIICVCVCVIVRFIILHTDEFCPIRPRCLSHTQTSVLSNLQPQWCVYSSFIFTSHDNFLISTVSSETWTHVQGELKISNDILPRNASLLQFELLIPARWETSTKSNQEERKMPRIQWEQSGERLPTNTKTCSWDCHWWKVRQSLWASNQWESD